MQISQLAKQTGVSVHALRHYEQLGLLKPARLPNGYRDYSDSMRREVIFITMSRQIGFSLPSIAEVLPSYRAKRLTFDVLAAHMRNRISEIDSQIKVLKTQRQKAVDHIAWVKLQQQKQDQQTNLSRRKK
jgi:MerR family transcriptional regulator, copper efflux regulator